MTADNTTLECERITRGMPELRVFSVYPNAGEERKR